MSLNDQINFEDRDLSYYIEALDGYDPWPILEEHCSTLQLDDSTTTISKLESPPNYNMEYDETLAITNIPVQENTMNELGNPSSSKCKLKFVKSSNHEIKKGIGEMEKKLDHNARERMRRMKLNQSYISLRSLLPDARRSKKRWSSAKIVEKVLEYIPKVEDEVRKLKEMVMNEEAIQADQRSKQNIADKYSVNSVMVNEVKRGEVIVQACMKSSNVFSSILMNNLEVEEGLLISSASTVTLSDQTTICCTLHIQVQMNGNYLLGEEDYVTVLRRKLISWLL